MLGALRKAGEKLLDFDAAYAGKISDGVMESMKDKPGVMGVLEGARGMTSGLSMRDIYQNPHAGKPEGIAETIQQGAIDHGLALANVASRYALPAGGVVLAGKGLYDVATGFGGQADQPEQATLPM